MKDKAKADAMIKRNEKIRRLIAEGVTYEVIAYRFGVSRGCIHRVIHGNRKKKMWDAIQ